MKKIFTAAAILLVLIPLVMWLTWLAAPKTKLVAVIIDKTVMTPAGQEHISLNWVLNYERYTKTPTKAYLGSRDYFGFFPLDNNEYQVKGLERFSSNQLLQMSEDADMIYITDTYGIYNQEWYPGDPNRTGMLYGGLSSNDLEMLKLMKEKNKLIITEYNTIGSPTAIENRKEFENLFKLKWTGWSARYFDDLNIKTNPEIPHWLITNYKKSHNNQWPFKSSGIAFINKNNDVLILEKGVHLTKPLPYIFSNTLAQESLSLPEKIKYPFWFDIMIPNENVNEIISTFRIQANDAGLEELKKFGLSNEFPAVTRHLGEDYNFYYFSGDFSDNPVNLKSSYFKGIGFFKGFFYNDHNPVERASFFWKFYRPLVTNILKEDLSRQNQGFGEKE